MVTVAYHTDPACPWSWALEPSVRKLMVEFSGGLHWTFVMGGLARSFVPEGSRTGTVEPPELARLMTEWLEVSAETGAPLDPLVWPDHPIRSTYPACMAVKAAAEQAERLCTYIQSLVVQSGENEVGITVSIGLAQYRIHHEDWQGFLSRADAALYKAKNNGRNQWAIAEE